MVAPLSCPSSAEHWHIQSVAHVLFTFLESVVKQHKRELILLRLPDVADGSLNTVHRVTITMVTTGRSTTCARCAFTHLGFLAKAIGYVFSFPMCSQMPSLDIFVNPRPFGCKLKVGLHNPFPPVCGLEGTCGSGIGPPIR